MIKYSKPQILIKSKCLLGEGIGWDGKKKEIYFVDIKKKKFFFYNIKKKKKISYTIDKEIGFVFPLKDEIYILGVKNQLYFFNRKKNTIIKKKKLINEPNYNRINDGGIDPDGNLWFGTMHEKGKKIKKGSLYCFEKKSKLIKVEKNKYFTPNGPVFLKKIYFIIQTLN